MNTKSISIALICFIGIAGVWYLLSAREAAAPTADTAATVTGAEVAITTPAANDDDSVTDVMLTDAGFSPAIVTINVGDTVRFTNNSSSGMWVGSDDHPTHTDYDGTATRDHCQDGQPTNGTFDACRATGNGETWDFTFTKAGTFGYHNHVGSSRIGTIIVK